MILHKATWLFAAILLVPLPMSAADIGHIREVKGDNSRELIETSATLTLRAKYNLTTNEYTGTKTTIYAWCHSNTEALENPKETFARLVAQHEKQVNQQNQCNQDMLAIKGSED